MIAALDHDLGKLKSMQGYLYSLGEHPLAAGRPLTAIAVNALPKKEEILRAIKLHHKTADGLLGKTLKKADQRARQKEMEEAVAAMGREPEAAKTASAPLTTIPPANGEEPTTPLEQMPSKSSLLMLLAAIFPHGMAYLLDHWHRYLMRRQTRCLSG